MEALKTCDVPPITFPARAFQAALDGELITHFESNKVRAPLAYLATASQRPHPRDVLAGLLWPERRNPTALRNLRQALHNLRRAIHDQGASPPFLLVTRDTVQFNVHSDCWVDVAEFQRYVADSESKVRRIHEMQSAVNLCRGPFLEGLSVRRSVPFEEWVLFKRETYDRRTSSVLQDLADIYRQQGEFPRAADMVRQRLELEPWNESIHRQLMHLLARSGQRSAALAQYNVCRRLLAEELGVSPSQETTALYEQIRDGPFPDQVTGRQGERDNPPPFPPSLSPHLPISSPLFVARDRELAKLHRFLEIALAGHGRVAFVAGDAGSGKATLVAEFTRRAMKQHGEVLTAGGSCNAYPGIGDPCLPLREIMQTLTGDIEAKRAAGAISADHARRWWDAWPTAVQSLVEDGPELIGTFVAATRLLAYTATVTPNDAVWRDRLKELVTQIASEPATNSLPRPPLFEQVTRVLQTLARRHPLILVVDDLQWADAGSVSLLFHLGRRLAGHRILVIGAYRADDVALLHNGERHPLQSVVNEFRRDLGDIVVDLNRAGGREFVEAFLDSQPNRLGPAFRETLYQHTGGHALFTVELLRNLQDHGNIVQDDTGQWSQGSALDWDRLPSRIEAVIAEQTSRLPEDWRAMLNVASVEGVEFTAEVIARVQGVAAQEVSSRLSGTLSEPHHLVARQSILRLDVDEGQRSATGAGQTLPRYGFRHSLFQKYLYSALDKGERSRLHEAVGNTLEALCGEQAGEIAGTLARHFEAAGQADRAADYLLQAGWRAVQLSANAEAITLFTKGLALLRTTPESPERSEREIAFQLALGGPLLAAKGWGGPERTEVCDRAYELCERTGDPAQLLQALFSLADLCRAQGGHDRSLELGEQLVRLAQRAENNEQMALAHWTLGETCFFQGKLAHARAHLEEAIALHDPDGHRSLLSLTGPDTSVTCLSWLPWVAWNLGDPDQAQALSERAIALAQRLDHPFSLVFALIFAGCGFHWLRQEAGPVRELSDLLLPYVSGDEAAGVRPWVTVFRGWEQATRGELAEGIAQMRDGLETWKAMGAVSAQSCQAVPLAEAYAQAEQPAQGLGVVTEALAIVERTGERLFEPELYRLKGELLLMQDQQAPAEAETCLLEAIELSRQQQAKQWELRATASLRRLRRPAEPTD
jgi:predicted ATPase/DNA-binding SARP family transcriptional activator